MADEVLKTNEPLPGDAPGLTADDIANTGNALDRLLKEATGDEPVPDPEKKDGQPAPEPAPEPDPEKKEEPAPEPPPEPDPEKKEEPAPERDELDSVDLPTTKPKSVEAFDKVKQIAREKIKAAEEEREKLRAQVTELEAKANKGLPPEVEAELKELRAFRSKLDVEADPEFKTFDKQISENTEAIYARLKAAGTDEASIEKIKQLGGPGEVDWDAAGSKIPANLKRFIEGKIYENEGLLEKKGKAIAEAKKNADEYLKSREDAFSKMTGTSKKHVEQAVSSMVGQLGWMKEKVAAKDAKPEEKAAIEAHNKLVREAQQDIKEATEDDSPETRAILILGFAQLRQVRADFEAHKKTAKAEKAAVEAELKTAKEFIEKIKKSSTSRIRDTPATTEGGDKPDAKLASPNVSGSDALDAHFKAAQAAQG